MMLSLIVITIIAFFLYAKYYMYTYWERNRFPSLKPSLFVGNLNVLVTRQKTSFGLSIYNLYQQATTPFVGIYLFYRPAVLVRDARLVKKVLSTDFNHFHDRGIYSRPVEDPISDHLFAMTGHRWRNLRAKFTPIFTSGRLRNMHSTIRDKGDALQDVLRPLADKNEIIEVKDLTSRFALDVIASVFFGLDVDTLTDPDHSFRMIEKLTQNNKTFLNNAIPISIFLCPKFLELLRLPALPPQVRSFILKLVTEQIEIREKDDVIRKDFIQFLIQIRNSGSVNADESEWKVNKSTEKTMSIEQCAGNIFIFYTAGFDTSASAVAYTVFECARNSSIMGKLRRDIDSTLDKYNGQLTYECLQDMKYLDYCIMETIRKYPTLPVLNRICTKDYKIPDTELTIKEGTAVVISLLGISRDPEYYPEPMTYRPERFSDEIPQYNTDAYIPFGDGPRTCIGLRLGKLVAKMGIIKLLQKYDFETVNDAELEFDNYGVTLVVKGGINLKISHRK